AAAEACRRILGAQATMVARGNHDKPLLCLRPALLATLETASAGRTLPAADGANRAPANGTVLGERYQVMALLGSGGMGAVYKVRDRDLDEIVALKMLRPGVLLDAAQLERLKDE